MSIEILAKKGNTTTVVDDANNKKDARQSVNYWQALKGKGWKVFSRPAK